MKFTRSFLLPLALVAWPAVSAAQGIGSRVPTVELEGYANTKADSFEDFAGRAVLIEFFAFW